MRRCASADCVALLDCGCGDCVVGRRRSTVFTVACAVAFYDLQKCVRLRRVLALTMGGTAFSSPMHGAEMFGASIWVLWCRESGLCMLRCIYQGSCGRCRHVFVACLFGAVTAQARLVRLPVWVALCFGARADSHVAARGVATRLTRVRHLSTPC